jgi:2-polyprenyl-6-methoxyphenol hydroxylase-like FAD-dependent oxidoreductase
MARIVIIGGGIGGLTTALLLARDGHHVTVLERDAASAPAPDEAFDRWERRGVAQFRQPHVFLPRFRQILDDELPDVVVDLVARGALRTNRLTSMPEAMTGGIRPSDERYTQVTGRRAMVEATMAAAADREPAITVRRGATVTALVTGAAGPDGAPHVAGVALADGEHVAADLVVDASGRRSVLPRLLREAGATSPVEEVASGSFVYYCRHFRSPDGQLPPLLGPPLQPYDSVSFVLIPGDNGHWSIGLMAGGTDSWMRAATDPDVWTRIAAAYPLVAPWLEGEPTTDVQVMARTPDRLVRFVVDGRPVATGVVAIGDAAATTSPAYGRGMTLAAMQSLCLRDVLREVSPTDAGELAHRWHDRIGNTVWPFVRDTLAVGRHRLAEIEAQVAGVPYETDDESWQLLQALGRAAPRDPELLRAMLNMASVFERGADIKRRPRLVERLAALGDLPPLPGPSRRELVEHIGAEPVTV